MAIINFLLSRKIKVGILLKRLEVSVVCMFLCRCCAWVVFTLCHTWQVWFSYLQMCMCVYICIVNVCVCVRVRVCVCVCVCVCLQSIWLQLLTRMCTLYVHAMRLSIRLWITCRMCVVLHSKPLPENLLYASFRISFQAVSTRRPSTALQNLAQRMLKTKQRKKQITWLFCKA